jgi:hypothetical protein
MCLTPHDSSWKFTDEWGNRPSAKQFNDNYYAVSFRYGEVYYIEIEPIKYLKSHESTIKVGIGLSIGF